MYDVTIKLKLTEVKKLIRVTKIVTTTVRTKTVIVINEGTCKVWTTVK